MRFNPLLPLLRWHTAYLDRLEERARDAGGLLYLVKVVVRVSVRWAVVNVVADAVAAMANITRRRWSRLLKPLWSYGVRVPSRYRGPAQKETEVSKGAARTRAKHTRTLANLIQSR